MHDWILSLSINVLINSSSFDEARVESMLLILDGNSEIDAHIRGNHYYFIWLRHLMRSRGVTNQIFFSGKICLHACVTCFELPSNISTMLYPDNSIHFNRNRVGVKSLKTCTVLKLDVNWRKIGLFGKQIGFLTALDLLKCLKQIK